MADEIQKATEDLKLLLQALEAVNATEKGAAQIKPVLAEIGGKEGLDAYKSVADSAEAGVYLSQLNSMIKAHEQINRLIQEQIQLTKTATESMSSKPAQGADQSWWNTVEPAQVSVQAPAPAVPAQAPAAPSRPAPVRVSRSSSEPVVLPVDHRDSTQYALVSSNTAPPLRSSVGNRPQGVSDTESIIKYISENPHLLATPAGTYDEATTKKIVYLQQLVERALKGKSNKNAEALIVNQFRSLFPVTKDSTFRQLQGSVGDRPAGMDSLEKIVQYVSQNPEQLAAVSENTHTEETVERLNSFLQGIAKTRSGRADSATRVQTVLDFRKLFPKDSSKVATQDSRAVLIDTIKSVFSHIGMADMPAIQNLPEANDQYIMDLLKDSIARVGVVNPDTGRVNVANLEVTPTPSRLVRIIRGLGRVVKQAITRRSVSTSEVDASDLSAEVITQVEDFRESDPIEEQVLADEIGGKIFKPIGNSGGGTVYARSSRFTNNKAQESLRNSIRGNKDYKENVEEIQDKVANAQGTDVTGYDASSVFPISSVQSISQSIKAQREQVNEEIVAGKFKEVEIGGRIYRLPETLANKQVAIARAAHSMSKDTSLVGRRARSDRKGGIGIYGAASIQDETINLHAAAMLEHYLSNPEEPIESSLDSQFMREVVTQELDIDQPRDANTQNALRLYAQRSIESLQSTADFAYENVAAATNPAGRTAQVNFAERTLQQKAFIEKILSAKTSREERGRMLDIPKRVLTPELQEQRNQIQKKAIQNLLDQGHSADKIKELAESYAEGTLTPEQRRPLQELIDFDTHNERTVEVEGEYEPLTIDQALTYIYGADIAAVPKFEDASIGIRRYATKVSKGLAKKGVARPARPYRTKTTFGKIMGTATNEGMYESLDDKLKKESSFEDQLSSVGLRGTERDYRDAERPGVAPDTALTGPNMTRPLMMRQEIYDLVDDFFGLSTDKNAGLLSTVNYASQLTDGKSAINTPEEIKHTYDYYADPEGLTPKDALGSLFAGAEDFRSLADTSLPIIDYAKLATKESRSEYEQSALDTIQKRNPAFAQFDEDQLKRLAAVDVTKSPKQIVRQIIEIIGKQVQEAIIRASTRILTRQMQDKALTDAAQNEDGIPGIAGFTLDQIKALANADTSELPYDPALDSSDENTRSEAMQRRDERAYEIDVINQVRRTAADAANQAESQIQSMLNDYATNGNRPRDKAQAELFDALDFFELDTFDNDLGINSAFGLIDRVIEDQTGGMSQLDFFSSTMGNAVPNSSVAVDSSEDTRKAVLEIGRTTAQEEAGRTTGVTAVRRKKDYGEEYDSNQQYAEGLIQKSKSADESKRKEALQTIAMHRAVAKQRGGDPAMWASEGLIGQEEGFSGDHVSRAIQFLNYTALQKKAAAGDTDAREEAARIDEQRALVRERALNVDETARFQYNPILGERAYITVSPSGRELLQGTPYSGQVKTANMQDEFGEDVYETGTDMNPLIDSIEKASLPTFRESGNPELYREMVLLRNPDLRAIVAQTNRQLNQIGNEDIDSDFFPSDLNDTSPGGQADQIDDMILQLLKRREEIKKKDNRDMGQTDSPILSYSAERLVGEQLGEMSTDAYNRLHINSAASLLSEQERESLTQERENLIRDTGSVRKFKPSSAKEKNRLHEINKKLAQDSATRMAMDPRFATPTGIGTPQLLEAIALTAENPDRSGVANKAIEMLAELTPEEIDFLNTLDLSDKKKREEAIKNGPTSVVNLLKKINFRDPAIKKLLASNYTLNIGEESTRRGDRTSPRNPRQAAKRSRLQLASDALAVKETDDLGAFVEPAEPKSSFKVTTNEDLIKQIRALDLDTEEGLAEAEKVVRASESETPLPEDPTLRKDIVKYLVARYVKNLSRPQSAPTQSRAGAVVKNLKGVNAVVAAERRGEGVSTLRKQGVGDAHYGNPFTLQKPQAGEVPVTSVKEAVDRYKAWLAGTADQDVKPEQRDWILSQIDAGALDDQDLLYYTQLNEPSHADALAEFVNNRKRSVPEPEVATAPAVSAPMPAPAPKAEKPKRTRTKREKPVKEVTPPPAEIVKAPEPEPIVVAPEPEPAVVAPPPISTETPKPSSTTRERMTLQERRSRLVALRLKQRHLPANSELNKKYLTLQKRKPVWYDEDDTNLEAVEEKMREDSIELGPRHNRSARIKAANKYIDSIGAQVDDSADSPQYDAISKVSMASDLETVERLESRLGLSPYKESPVVPSVATTPTPTTPPVAPSESTALARVPSTALARVLTAALATVPPSTALATVPSSTALARVVTTALATVPASTALATVPSSTALAKVITTALATVPRIATPAPTTVTAPTTPLLTGPTTTALATVPKTPAPATPATTAPPATTTALAVVPKTPAPSTAATPATPTVPPATTALAVVPKTPTPATPAPKAPIITPPPAAATASTVPLLTGPTAPAPLITFSGEPTAPLPTITVPPVAPATGPAGTSPRTPRAPRAPKPAPAPAPLITFSGAPTAPIVLPTVPPVTVTPRAPRAPRAPKPPPAPIVPFSGAPTAPLPTITVPPVAPATGPAGTSPSTAPSGGGITAPGATITVTGGTVTITGSTVTGGTGGTGGAGGSGTGGTGGTGGGGGGGFRRSNLTDMIFGQMDVLSDRTKDVIRAAPDEPARIALVQAARDRYAKLQQKALQTQIDYGSPSMILNPTVPGLVAGLDTSKNPLQDLNTMTEAVLQDQIASAVERDRIENDPTLSAADRKLELAALDASDRELNDFAAVLKKVTEDLNRFQQAVRVPNTAFGNTSGRGGGGGGGPTIRTASGKVLSEADVLALSDLESKRNLYASFQGNLPNLGSRFDSQLDLTRRTRRFADATLSQLPAVDLTGVDFMGDVAKETAANAAAAELQDAIAQIKPNTLETRPIEELAVDLSRVNEAAIKLNDVIEGAGNVDAAQSGIQNVVTATGFAERQQARSGAEIDKQSASNARNLEENMQAIVSQPGLIRRLTGGVQREGAQHVREYLRGIFGDSAEGRKATDTMFYKDQMVAYDDRGRRRNIVGASTQELQNLQARVKAESGMDVSMDDLQRTQRAMARVQQARNQSPFNDVLSYGMSKMRDLDSLGQTVMGVMNAPQTIASTISQIGDPQLRTDRIMTTARALSLSPETYTKALAAATQQQSRFGGTLSKNLEDMTSFIPISNTYGVDVGKSVQVARKLAAFDPAQGMQGASIALKEFLSGNVSSLSRRFEINRSDLSKINTGDANEMLDSLDTLLGKMGVTDKLIDDQANSLATKYDRMTGRLETMQVGFSAFAVNAMTPILEPILGDKSFLAKGALDQNLQKVVTERLKSYGDSVLSDPKTGLKTVDVFSSDFVKKLDPLLGAANDSTSTAALDFTGMTGNVSNVELYRRMGNMSDSDRRRIQQSAQMSVLMGMNQEPAILKAMRDVGGDFFSGEEFQAQRRPLGFYGQAMDAPLKRQMLDQAEKGMKLGQEGQQVEILHQVDADTYDVRMPDGKRERVRLAGVDAPEKNTKEGQQASAYARYLIGTDPNNPKNKKKTATLYSKGDRDAYGRLMGSVAVGGRDLGTALVASGSAAVYNFEGKYGEDLIAPLSALERNAANTGMGPINEQAARLGLGANSEISQTVRDKYFRDKYMSVGGLYGAVGGAIGGTILGGVNAFTALGAAGGVAGAAGVASIPVLPIAAGIAALTAAGTIGYSAYTDSKDTSAPKMRELYRLQSEEDLQKQSENVGNQLYRQAARDNQARASFEQNAKNPFQQLYAKSFNYFSPTESQKAREAFVSQYTESGKELSKYYNGLASDQKKVYELVVNDPATKQRTSVFKAIQMYQSLIYRDAEKTDIVAHTLLEQNESNYNDFASRVYDTMQASKLIETAQEYGIRTTYETPYKGTGPMEAQRTMGTVSSVMDLQQFYDLSKEQRDSVAKQLDEAINTPSWKRFATEYTDQAMEKQFAMSQQRFTTFVDNTALNSLAGMNPGQLSSSVFGFRSTGTGRALEDPLDSEGNPVSALVAPSLRAMSRTIFNEGVDYDESGKEKLKTAQEQAVKSLEQQIVAYREQEDLTRPFNLALKSTYSNFIQTLQKSAGGYSDIMTYLSQGNPRGFLDVSQQMSGFNMQSIMQNRITTQNQGVMGIGSVAAGTSGPIATGRSFNYGYTTGPQGTIQYARDFMRAPERSLFNPAAIESVIMQGVQANTEIVQRNLDFSRKLRDAELANRRAIEDINLNGMRSLEDIHRTYTRNMIQLAQQSETSKRLGTAQFYTGAVAANIDPNEKARITASREQGQQKASHIEQADVGTYLKSSDGMQDTELQKAYAEYQATPFTNATVKEASWKKVMDIVQVRRSQTKARMENATEVPERSAAEAQFGLLSDNYDRGQQYRKYVDDMYNQQMEFAGRRKQLGINRVDLEREGGRLREKTPELAMQLGKARTPEEIRAARNAIEDNNVAIQKNSEALAQNARELESVTITAPLWADNWREAGKQILESSTSTISGLLNNLEDFNINYARQLEDAYKGFNNAKKDMIKQFTDAAIEISQAVPAEFAGALSAITAYQRMSLKAEAYYNSGNVEAARSVQKLANYSLAGSLYPKGSVEYDAMVNQLDSNVTSMTAEGMRKDDSTLGPSGLGAYGEMGPDGKYVLRVVIRGETKTTNTPPPGGSQGGDGQTGNGSSTVTGTLQ